MSVAAASAGVSGITAVQARIAAIQSRFATVAPAAATTTAAPGAGTGNFDSMLAGYMGGTSSVTGSFSADAVTGGRATGDAAVQLASKYLGTPYVWGGETPSGFDCSGLVQYVFGQLGVALPRTSDQQMTVGQAVPDMASAKPGDLLFFAGKVTHVGIYAGNGMMIDAPHTGDVVKLEKVWATPTAIRRMAPAASSPAAFSAAGVGSLAGSGVQQYSQLFQAAGARYGVPASLLAAVAQTESAGRADAVSPAGARGLMQLMPGTAAGLGVDPMDPAQAVDGAARLLAGHLQRFGSTELALAAYNAGGGAVQRYGGIPPYPETQGYVRKVMALVNQYGALS